MATVGRQLCQRSCMRPASRVEPNSPITTDGFLLIAASIKHYPISAVLETEHQGAIRYVARYLLVRTVNEMAASLHGRGIEYDKRTSERRFVSEIGITNQRERRVIDNDPAPLRTSEMS